MPGLRLEGKNAIVTGAAGGIGLETTILFLREGASVVLADISEPALEKALAKAKEVVPDAVGKVKTAKCDVSKESDIKALVDSVDEWGGLDIMFNNAGIMHADDAGKFHGVLQESCWPHILIHLRRRRHTREDLGPDPEHQRQGRVVRQQARCPFPPQAQED